MTDVFPGGWRKGDTCYLITNRAKRTAAPHTVESFDGRYFGVHGNSGVCSIISLMMTACYWIAVFDIHPIESIKGAIHRRFSKETAEE